MNNCKSKNAAFTLIELLVVISIIAVLLSILMPALNKAKRAARVILCSSNLHQLAIGLNSYASDHGRYMARGAGYPSLIYHTDGVLPDMREMLVEYVAYKKAEVMFCPAANCTDTARGAVKPGVSSNLGGLTAEQLYWRDYFWLGDSWYGGNPVAYRIGFNLYAGLQGDLSYFGDMDYDWQYSGNSFTAYAPRVGGSARDCLAADVQEAWPEADFPGWGYEGNPYMSNHAKGWITSTPGVPGVEPSIKFIDSNAAFGDGHVEKRKKLEYGVRRLMTAGDPSTHHGLFEY